MLRNRLGVGGVLLALVSLLSFLAPGSSATPKWLRIHTPNFIVVGDAGEGQIRHVARHLEQFREVMGLVIADARIATPIPTFVVVFATDAAFRPYKPLRDGKPANIGGYFSTDGDNNCIALHLEQTERAFQVVFHEYAHLLMRDVGPVAPMWVREGLAEYYSTFSASSNGRDASIGRPIAAHVQLLRERFMPLGALLAADRTSPIFSNRDDQTLFYAESWALVHYLLKGSEAGTSQLTAFLDLLGAGKSHDQALEQAFGRTVKVLENEVRDYVHRSVYGYTIYTFPKQVLPPEVARAAPMSDAERDAGLGWLLTRVGRVEEGLKLLESAVARDGGMADARAFLGRVYLRTSRHAEALEHLEQAAALDADNPFAHYDLARALLSSRSASLEPAQTERALAALTRTVELRPAFPQGWQLLGRVAASARRYDDAERAFRRSLTLTPGSTGTALELADVYLVQQKLGDARRVLSPLARSTAGSEDEAAVQRRMQFLERQELLARDRAAFAAAAGTPPPADPAAGAADRVQLPSPTPPPAMMYRFRETGQGETRQQGFLTSIDCLQGRIVLNLRTAERTLRFGAARFEDVDFITYRNDLRGSVSCGPWKEPTAIYLTSRRAPAAGKSAGNPWEGLDGLAVAVEFLPKDWGRLP